VLEHLRDPASVLRRIRPFIVEGGEVVSSLPNIAHGSIRLALLAGEFRYRETGLLDKTHLRFFTRESIRDLFEQSGYVVTHWQRARLDIDRAEVAVPRFTDGARELIVADPDVTTYQFIIQAIPAREPDVIRALRTDLEHLPEQLRELEALRQTLTEQREQLDRLGEQVAMGGDRDRELRTMLVEAHDQLVKRDEEIRRLDDQLSWVFGTRLWKWRARAAAIRRKVLPRA
jgi:hypothetical protein